MRQFSLFRWRPTQETGFASLLFILVVGVNLAANLLKETPVFFLLYQGVLIVGLGIFMPLWYICRSKEQMDSIGLTLRNWKKAVVYALVWIAFSIPWRLKGVQLFNIDQGVLLSTSVALLMTSFFEELFFRGFLQTRFQKAFGMIPALILSGLTFSLYHLGYAAYQNVHLLFMLFWVGLFFAIAFRTTGNVITSFLVNLPHAILSFLQNGSYFDTKSAVVSGITMCFILYLIVYFNKKVR